MRWSISLALALSVAACRQTIVLDQHVDGGGGGADSGPGLCTGPPLAFAIESPEVIVALDRSLGMGTRFGDSTVLTASRDAIAQYATVGQRHAHQQPARFAASQGSDDCGDAVALLDRVELPPAALQDAGAAELDGPRHHRALRIGDVELDVAVRIGPFERGDDAGDRHRLGGVEHREGMVRADRRRAAQQQPEREESRDPGPMPGAAAADARAQHSRTVAPHGGRDCRSQNAYGAVHDQFAASLKLPVPLYFAYCG